MIFFLTLIGGCGEKLITKQEYTKKIEEVDQPDSLKPYYDSIKLIPRISDGKLRYSSKIYFVLESAKGVLFHERVTNTGQHIPFKIDFFNDKRNLVNSFEIQRNNPFNHKDYPLISKEQYINYSAAGVGIDYEKEPLYDFKKDVNEYYTNTNIWINENGYSVINYNLQPIDKQGRLIGWLCDLILLNPKGERISEFENIQLDINNALITSDGKYLSIRYGGNDTENYKRLRNDGIRIYNIANDKIIYENKLPKAKSYSGPSEIDTSFITFGITDHELYDRDDSNYYHKEFYDIQNRVKYYRDYHRNEMTRLRGVTREGQKIIDDKSGKNHLLKFKDDFSKQNF